jgi:hypothetical protein
MLSECGRLLGLAALRRSWVGGSGALAVRYIITFYYSMLSSNIVCPFPLFILFLPYDIIVWTMTRVLVRAWSAPFSLYIFLASCQADPQIFLLHLRVRHIAFLFPRLLLTLR